MINIDLERARNNIYLLDKILFAEIEIIYSNDYWDGPLEGLCMWKEREYYFLWSGEMDNDDEIKRRFFIINLTPLQMQEERLTRKQYLDAQADGKLNDYCSEQLGESPATINIDQIIGWSEII